MELPDVMTYGEAYNPAMRVTTEDEAREYMAALIRRHVRVTGDSDAEAERIERINVGYWSGYFDPETATRVRGLYGVPHPILGNTDPTPERVMDAGKAMASLAEAAGDADINIEAFGRAWQAASGDIESR